MTTPEWVSNLTWPWVSKWLINGAVLFGFLMGIGIGFAFGYTWPSCKRCKEKRKRKNA